MNPLSRRDFLKLSAIGLSGIVSLPWQQSVALPFSTLLQPEFPPGERLGRVNVGRIEIKSRPDGDSQTVGMLYEDAVVPWLREVAGRNIYRENQRWVETPDGYVWSPYLQPVRNLPIPPIDRLPENPSLGPGMWVEVTVPYVDLLLYNPPDRAPWLEYKLENGISPRLYYSQVTWVDQLKTGQDGQVWYRINEKYGNYGDIFWCDAQAFRPITQEEIAPIRPEVENKRILVDVTYQTMSCLEGNSEVLFTRISSGAKWNVNGERVDTWRRRWEAFRSGESYYRCT